jgi:hypothetical protein
MRLRGSGTGGHSVPVATVRRALFALAIAAAPASCAAGGGPCRIGDPPTSPAAAQRPLADLSAAKPYRNYYAVTKVGPAGHHFVVNYVDAEPVSVRVRATVDAAGSLRIDEEGQWFGGLAGPAYAASLVAPSELLPLARAVEAELKKRCSAARNLGLRYDGSYREIQVAEFIAHTRGATRGGWIATTTLSVAASLTRFVGQTLEGMSGWGVIEVPRDTQWVEFAPPPREEGSALRTAHGFLEPALAERVLVAARRADARASSIPLEVIARSQSDSLLPDGYVSRVAARISIGAATPVLLSSPCSRSRAGARRRARQVCSVRVTSLAR